MPVSDDVCHDRKLGNRREEPLAARGKKGGQDKPSWRSHLHCVE